MRINNNIMAMNTHRQLGMANSMSARSMEKLSSGFRINRAGDDAAGLAISEKMRAQIRGLNQASRNSQDAISLIQTAEGALSETHSILQRMRELAVQASTDTNVEVDRDEIQKEMNELSSEINRIGASTEFNTQKLINGDKENSLTTSTGAWGTSGASATSTISGSITVASLSVNTASGLSSGSNTVVVSRVGEGTVQSGGDLTAQSADISDFNAMSGGDITFSGNGIVVGASGEKVAGSGLTITFNTTANGSGTITISGSGASGAITDTVNVVNGAVNYNNFGISFNITSVDALAGASMIISGASGATYGTDLKLYAAANTGGDNWMGAVTTGTPSAGSLSGGDQLPDTEMTWTITLSGASGTSGFKISGVGADGTTVITDEFEDDIANTAHTYDAYGLNFVISGGSGAAGDEVTFTTTPTYTYTVSAASGTQKFSGVQGSGGDTDFVASGGVDIYGVSIASGATLSVGSGRFDVVMSITSGTDNSMDFQIGANQNQNLTLSIGDMRANNIGISHDSGSQQWIALSRQYDDLSGNSNYTVSGGTAYIQAQFTSSANISDGTSNTLSQYSLDLSSGGFASIAITVINDSIERVSSERSKLGAYQNRLEHTIANLDTSSENLQASESRIRDVDMAKEMMAFTRNNILTQAAQAMLAQANQAPQGVLQLLR